MQARASRWKRLSESTPFRYGLALVVTALALEARQLLDPFLGDYTPYITLFGGVAILSIYAGIGPALFSAVLGLVGVLYWFMPPRQTFVFWSNPAYPVSVIAYLTVCGLIAAAGELSRKLKRELESSRILFETFLDNSPGTEFLKDASTGKYVYVNETGKARFSKNPVGRTDFELFPGPLAAKLREQEFKVMWQNEAHEFTSTTQEADGEHTWLTLMFPVLDPQGSKLLGGKAIDVTGQQRAEQEIARLHQERGSRDAADLEVMTRLHELGITCLRNGSSQSECLNAILETAIFISGANKGNIQLFEAATDSLRIVAQRGFEEPFLQYFALVRDIASACGAAMQSARPVIVEDVAQSELFAGSPSLNILLDAGVRAVQSTPLVSSTKEVLGMISIHFSQPHKPSERELRFIDLLSRQAADYLTRKKTEGALQESEAQFRMLANAIPQLCWMANPDGWIFWYNERWYEYTGMSHEDVEGWGWQSVHDPEILPVVLERWKKSLCDGQPFEMTFPLRGTDGVMRPFLTRVIPVKDGQGKVVRWFGTNTDVTHLKRTDEEFLGADKDPLPRIV